MYENYCKIRDMKNLKDSDVAKGTGITKSTFSEWKKGRYSPKIDKIRKIADFLGVSIEAITTEKITTNKSVNENTYYYDYETTKMAQDLFENPNYRILFDAARDSKPEDLEMAAELLYRLKGTNPNG